LIIRFVYISATVLTSVLDWIANEATAAVNCVVNAFAARVKALEDVDRAFFQLRAKCICFYGRFHVFSLF